MAKFLWTNDAKSTLASPISNVATSLTVSTGTGALFPNPGAGEQFALTLTDQATGIQKEIVYVSARAGDVMTIARAQEGTVAQSWSAGDICGNLITAASMAAFFQVGTFQGQQTTAYLFYISTTQIKLAPIGGNTLIINGSLYAIPAAGIPSGLTGVFVGGVAAQNLAASTVYDVFVFNNSGTLAYDFWSAGGHMTDTSAGNIGIEVRNNGGSPDSSRSYVGKILTDAVPHFQVQGVGVISWFNQKWLNVLGATIAGSISSSSLTEVSASARLKFITFGLSYNQVSPYGFAIVSNSVANAQVDLALGLNGSPPAGAIDALVQVIIPNVNVAFSTRPPMNFAEGQNTISPFMSTSAGTLTVTGVTAGAWLFG